MARFRIGIDIGSMLRMIAALLLPDGEWTKTDNKRALRDHLEGQVSAGSRREAETDRKSRWERPK
jgi:hypothetical protein